MTVTLLADVQGQVQEYWSAMFVDEVKETTLLPSLVNKDYKGEIKKGGDSVTVSQINRVTAERKTVGTAGSNTFTPSALTTSEVKITANQRITASIELEDLVDLQSQIGDENSALRASLVEALEIELNNFLYTKIAPSASAPNHVLTGVTDFDAAQMAAIKILASQARWRKNGWFLLADPVYHQDILNSITMTSADYVPDAPVVGGQIATKRFGFNILEDNSDGLLTLSSSSQDAAVAFHPDFMALVMQREPTFKISDQHANEKHGYLMSVDMLVGAELLPDGDNKHISIINA